MCVVGVGDDKKVVLQNCTKRPPFLAIHFIV
jgi:hypothetical protein